MPAKRYPLLILLLACSAAHGQSTWWSFQPISAASPPSVAPRDASSSGSIPTGWEANPIDGFVYAKMQEHGLTPNPPAERRSLIRRATYDLTGLPPTPEDVAAFVADDSPDAYERLIDRLLASEDYGRQWGRHWLDVVRFGESNGFERNVIINRLWPFRDYVIRSFNEDKPFDQLVREHLAGDVLAPQDRTVAVGAAFLVCGPYDNVGNSDPVQGAQIRANTIDEVIRATTEAFLGLTVGCARCHDHKFDPISQHDYYALYATFAGVEHGSRSVETDDERRQRQAALEPLQSRRRELAAQKDAIEEQILQRALASADGYAAAWVRPPIDRRHTEEMFPAVTARFIRLVVEGQEADPHASSGYHIEEFEVWTADEPSCNVALASAGATADGVERVAQDFAGAYSADLTVDGKLGARWIAGGPELTITLAEPQKIDRVVFCSDRSGDAAGNPVANFVSEYRLLVSCDGEQWIEVASSRDRVPVNEAHRNKRLRERAIAPEEEAQLVALAAEIAEVDRLIAKVPPPPEWWIGNFREAAGPFHVFLGGDPRRKGELIQPSSLTAFAGVTPSYTLANDAPESERRRALAEWLVHRDNPLTPRVLANRLWHYHFGRGIVATPSDFGAMGGQPTHPQLLDWLARQVHEHHWRLKPLHKLIMMSQTYRQSAAYRPVVANVDADSRYLWRFPPRRLSAEEIRDTMLAISGQLQPDMGGPGFRLYRYLEDNVATYVPLDDPGPQTYRRSVYHQNARASSIDLLTDFDAPDCARSTPRRDVTTSPAQALAMLNHQFALDIAVHLAARIEREVGSDPTNQVRRCFQLAYTRPPDDEELRSSRHLVEQFGVDALCRAILNSSELIYLD